VIYTTPTQGVYSPAVSAYAAQVGTAVGGAIAGAYGIYELATAKGLRPADYVTGTYGVLGSVLAAVPVVGPMLQTYNLAVAGASYLNDSLKAKRKKDRIKRQIRGIVAGFDVSVSRGYPAELAAYTAARNAGQRTQYNLGILDAVARSPYNPRAPMQTGGAAITSPRIAGFTREQLYAHRPWVVDPETNELVTERELVARYGQHDRDVATQLELATRIAPARGYVPGILARTHA